jgi:hypothetical protein
MSQDMDNGERMDDGRGEIGFFLSPQRALRVLYKLGHMRTSLW